MVKQVRIDQITRDGRLQHREDSQEGPTFANPGRVAEYATLLGEGAEFPPVKVVDDGDTLWLYSGFHTVAAYQRLGKATVPAEVTEGCYRDGLVASAGENVGPAERSPGTKRRAVLALLTDPEWAQESDCEIARHCKVSQPFVGKVRAEHAAAGASHNGYEMRDPGGNGASHNGYEMDKPAPEGVRRVKRQGQVFEMRTGNIGRKPLEPQGDVADAAPEPALDALGRSIPPDLIPAFAARETFREARLLVRRLNGLLTSLALSPGGAHLARHLSRREEQGRVYYRSTGLEDFDTALKFHAPHSALCPWCEFEHPGRTDRACKACFGTGWVPFQLWGQAPEEYRAAAERGGRRSG